MGRGAQANTRQMTDQERANIDALNQQFLGQQQQVGNLLMPQYQSILNNPGLSAADKAAVTGQSQGSLASAFDSLQQSAQNRLARTRNSAGFGELTDELAPEGNCGGRPGATEPARVQQHRFSAADGRAPGALRTLRHRRESSWPHPGHSYGAAERSRKRLAQQRRRILLLARLRSWLHARCAARRVSLERSKPNTSPNSAREVEEIDEVKEVKDLCH